MYKKYPGDLSPSRVAVYAAHGGTVLEFAMPIVLLCGRGGELTMVGLVLMLVLHGFTNVPMGVLRVERDDGHGSFSSEARRRHTRRRDAAGGRRARVMCVALPPRQPISRPSALPLAMRYYAGNWAYSVWFFRDESYRKLDKVKKSSAWIYDQMGLLYDRPLCIGVGGKVMAFRLMHLHGRALSELVPKALPRFGDYEWVDGEIVAGMVLGWNFGDGHLHGEQLLHAVQEQCSFEEGELRCVMVESQPLGQSTLHYRILDAKTGQLEEGHVDVATLRARQPWGAPA